ncbi:uncharacterized protein LOC119361415 [Triticum dicoccoides]|uniref:uncharacterized protein LOC119361415 n=1 Tax=Triticum dicoccoides TaxID=85692 RepID=UPI00188DDAF4|nr:uncharacterized protein LOC119361415 [Triticum dicoccoides]
MSNRGSGWKERLRWLPVALLATTWCRWTLRRQGSRARSSKSCATSTSVSRRPSCYPPPAAPPHPTPSSHDNRRLLDKLVLYGLVELKVNGDGNCQFRALSDQFYRTPEHHRFVRQQVVNQHSRMYKKQSASVHARAPKKGSGGYADDRREVHGLDGVVVADVWRGEVAAHHLPLAPQHTGCGARVRWLPPSAGGMADIDRSLLELRARARDMTASQHKAAAVIGQVWLVEAARCVLSQL